MGTRSLTRVIPRQEGIAYNKGHEHGELAYVNMYRHYDGDPAWHGLDLAHYLKDFKIINEIYKIYFSMDKSTISYSFLDSRTYSFINT